MKTLQLSAASIALLWTGQAFAQVAPADPATEDVAAEESGQTGEAAGEATLALDQVTVTAQRREERLVDVPLSVSLVTSEQLDLAGGASLISLNKLVPGVYMQQDVYGLSPTVRGIGSTLSSSGGESNVPVYADGVYLPYKATNIFDLASVSNVQVLKGPQGTLFGRNATGGAILITTLDPSFDPEARFKVSYERFNQARGSAYVNMPLGDKLAANLAVTYRHSDGFIRDSRTEELVNEGESLGVRGKLLFEPVDSLSIVLTGYHSKFDDPTGSSYQSITNAPFYGLPGIDANSGPIATDRFHRSHNTEDVVETESNQYSAHVKWELDAGTLQSITSSQKSDLISINDLDSTYQTLVPAANASVDFKTTSDVFSQELNFTSNPGSDLQYVTGLYYYSSDSGVPYFLISGNPSFVTDTSTETSSAYVDANYRLDENWVLIGGLRYTRESREVNTRFVPAGTNVDEETESVWTPRAGVKFELTPDSNLYATYTRGYKAGIFDATSPLGNKVDPEFVDAYEIGYKASGSDFTLNTAAYYYDFKDTQVNAVFSSGGAIFQQLFNVPKSEIYGVDVAGTYRFSDAFDVSGAVAYTHARYKDFTNAPSYRLDPTDPATSGLFFASTSIDASGNHMVRAPDWTANGALNYHADLGSEMRLDASLSGSYTNEVFFNFSNSLSQDAYFLVDANATISISDNLTLSVFGRNLTDEVYYSFQTENALLTAGTFGLPRTYGLSVGYKF